MTASQRISLTQNWQWRLADANGNRKAEEESPKLMQWTPVTAFPSVIQMELLANNIIPDYNVGENERLVQWAGEADWLYCTTFPSPASTGGSGAVDLVFDGLDTFATVSLNGKRILESDNMFIAHRINVKDHISPNGGENALIILFESAVKRGAQLESKYGKFKSVLRDSKRIQVRKPQYQWGWDCGPAMVTAGPYMGIHLDTYSAKIEDVHVTSDLSNDHSKADVEISITAVGTGAKTANVDIIDSTSRVAGITTILLDESGIGKTSTSVLDPQLWWPNGQGAQHLYLVSVSILDSSGNTLDQKNVKIGIRTIKLIQRPLKHAPGKTFMFNVNGRNIFSQGANWFPADNLLPRVTRERYFDLVKLGQYNNLNMMRHWGGGIYETEDFFDACDEVGILIWLDFALASGEWPMNQAWLDSFKAEAEFQTRRLRNRACLALLCGSNEDFLLEEYYGTKYDYLDHSGPFEDKPFPHRKVFLELLPEVCARLAPTIQYWPNSPWGDAGQNSNDLTIGDVHQWNVWHAEQQPYQKYKELSGRFVSEFGMHGFPVERTIAVFASDAQDQHPQSRAIDCHNKGHFAESRIACYVAENFRYSMDFRNFVYCTQLMQSEAYGYALRDWKRKFNPDSEECAGAIIWQFNDCYPVTSWSYMDYYLRPKPAFYTIRRNFAPISIGIERTPRTRFVDEDLPGASQIPTFAIFGHNTTAAEVQATLSLKAYDLHLRQFTNLEATNLKTNTDVTLLAGSNTEFGELPPHPSWTEQSLIVLQASLLDPLTDETLATFTDWPEPYRYLHWPADTQVSITVHQDSTEAPAPALAPPPPNSNFNSTSTSNSTALVSVTANHPIKGIWLSPVHEGTSTSTSTSTTHFPDPDPDPEPLWSDNTFDLLPQQTVTVRAFGLHASQAVTARFLGDWEVRDPVVQKQR